MTKPARLWVACAPRARVLLERGSVPVRAPHDGPAVVPSAMAQAAHLAGPWLLRAAVRLPRIHAPDADPHRSSRWLAALHARWLRKMGVGTATVYDGPAVEHWASFAAQRRGDVLIGGRKVTDLVELWRPRERWLVACTLLHAAPWELLCVALGRPQDDAVLLRMRSVSAASVAVAAGGVVDTRTWAASLRSMIHLALVLEDLQDDRLAEL